MKKIIKLIKKDIKLLLRSKTSSLIVIFGPLLVMLLVGTAFDNTSKYNINIGVYSTSYSELTESFIDKLTEEKYSVNRFDTELECVESIKQGAIHSCIIFPPDLIIEEGKTAEITFHIDFSKINLVWMVLDSLSSRLRARSAEISMDLTKALLEKLEQTKVEITNDLAIVEELKSKNNNIDAKIDQINTAINEIDADLIEDSNEGIYQAAYSSENNTQARLEDIEANLDSISSKASKLGNDSKVDSILNLASDSKGEIKGIRYWLGKSLNSTDTYWSEAKSKIKVLKINLAKMDALTNTIASDSIKKDITTAISNTDNLETSLANIQSSIGGIRITNAEKITSPITKKIEPVTVEKTHLNYLFSTILVLVVMFISLLLAPTIVMMEKTSPSFFRNFITPTRNRVFVFSTYLTTLLIVMVQLLIILLISGIFFKATLLHNIHNILLTLFLITSVFTLLGMLVGYAFNSHETAIIASISGGSLFLLLSNTILPLESMPKYMMQIAKFNPFVLSDNLLKKTILFQQSFSFILSDLGILFAYSLFLVVIILILQKSTKRISIRHHIRKAKEISDIDNLVTEVKAALKKKQNKEAKELFEQARKIYHKLRDSKSHKAKSVYKKLKKLHARIK